VRIELGGGQFADVKEVDELRSGDRHAANAAFTLRIDPETKQAILPGDMDDNMRRALLCRIITAWNLQWPLPSRRPDSLDKLTLEQEDALYKGIEEHFKVIKGQDEDPSEEGTVPTSDSAS